MPFLWERDDQPAARWHNEGEGPVHYLTDTPDGAWAEFLRHEEITDPADLVEIRRSLWAVEIEAEGHPAPELGLEIVTGGTATYPECREDARRLRATGARGLLAPTAALLPGAAASWRVDGGLRTGPRRDGVVMALFGPRPDLVALRAAEGGPHAGLLAGVRHLAPS